MNEKQKKFVLYTLAGCNATQAAIKAGYSEGSAHVQGHRLLSNDKVKAALDEGRARLAEKLDVKAEKLVSRLAEIAFGDLRDYISWGPDGVILKASDELPLAGALASIKFKHDEDGNLEGEIKLESKLKAIEMLGKHLGLFIERSEVKQTVELGMHPADIARAMLQMREGGGA